MREARAAIAAELLADLPTAIAEQVAARMRIAGLDVPPAESGAAVVLRREQPDAVRAAIGALEPILTLPLAMLPVDGLGDHLTVRWEASLALAVLVDADPASRLDLLTRWSDSAAFWALDPADGPTWQRLIDATLPPPELEPPPEPPPQLAPEPAAESPASPGAETPPEPEPEPEAEPAPAPELAPAPGAPVEPVASSAGPAPEAPDPVARAFAFLREHRMLDIPTLDRITGSPRWSRAFNAQVHALAAAAGERLVIEAPGGVQVWRLVGTP